jgi:hypothetical protein
MQYFISFFPIMALKQSKRELCKKLPTHFFRNVNSCGYFTPFCYFRLLHEVTLLSDKSGKVTTAAVFHYNIKFGLFFVDYSVVVPCDVGMLKFSQDVNFRNQLLFLFF